MLFLFVKIAIILLMSTASENYALSLHDALPISAPPPSADGPAPSVPRATARRRRTQPRARRRDRKSTRLNSSHTVTSYAVFCLKKKQQRRPFDAKPVGKSDSKKGAPGAPFFAP